MYLKYFYLLFAFAFVAMPASYGINSPVQPKEEVVKKSKKKNFLERIIYKKFKKLQGEFDADKNAKLALIFGLVSFGLLILLFAALASTVSGGFFGVMALITAGISTTGDVFAIKTLRKTRHDKAAYRKQRRKAKWGLVFALATGLIPLLLLLAVLLSV